MPTTRCDPRLDAGIVAATLRALGYAARSYSAPGEDGDPPEFGVAIHIVCTEAWRYPDGRWEIIDRPARLVAAAPSAPHTWLFNCGVAFLSPRPPPRWRPGLPRNCRRPICPSIECIGSSACPAHRQRPPRRTGLDSGVSTGAAGADVISPAATTSRNARDLLAHHGAAP